MSRKNDTHKQWLTDYVTVNMVIKSLKKTDLSGQDGWLVTVNISF